MASKRTSRSRSTSRTRNHTSESRESSSSTSSSSAPTPLDRNRFRLFRSGMTPAEIATREKVTIPIIERSILRCRIELQQYSQEEAELATRRAYFDLLPTAAQAIERAATAERTETKSVQLTVRDPETGEEITRTELIEEKVPDHDTQLKGVSALRQLLQSVQPRTPMVQVDARSQTNNLGLPHGMTQGQLGAGSGSFAQPTSAEAIIRAIRQERGLALTDGAAAAMDNAPTPLNIERDMELDDDLAILGEDPGDNDNSSPSSPDDYLEEDPE